MSRAALVEAVGNGERSGGNERASMWNVVSSESQREYVAKVSRWNLAAEIAKAMDAENVGCAYVCEH